LDSIEGLDESLQSHYVEQEDGTFRLNVETVGGWALEDVAGLKSSLAKERKNARTYAAELAGFDKDGERLDAEAAWEALTKLRDYEENPPGDNNEEIQQLRDQFLAKEKKASDKYQADLDALRTERDAIDALLNDSVIDTAVTAAIAKHEGRQKWLSPYVRKYVKATNGGEEGKRVARVIGPDGEERISLKSGSNDPMSVAEFVASLKDDPEWSDAFPGSGATGSGATGSDRASSGGTFRISETDAADPAKYRAARKRAAEAGKQLEVSGGEGIGTTFLPSE
jgi:hypothetical protein